jgi:CubicO group peptidase (beta-lactamase class C family)
VGGVIQVLHEGRVVYARAAGFADREQNIAMREDTVFRLSSVTKPIATIALLRLADAKQLELDAPVTKYLPDFRPKLPDGSEPAISLRQLLTHTAGLSYRHMQPADGSYLKHDVSDGFDITGLTFDEQLRRIVAAGLSYVPGTSWGYSIGLDVLGRVIEQVTKLPLPAAIAELVTTPLGLRDTVFPPTPNTQLATPYADGAPPTRMQEGQVLPFFGLSGLRFSPARAFDPESYPSAGAGMNGTAPEVAKVLEMVRSGGGRVLNPETARAMLTNQTGDLPIVFGPGWGFGFGGAVLVDPVVAQSPQSAGTWSWGGVWGHSWFVDPVRSLVVVALTNTAIEGMMGQFPGLVRNTVYSAFTSE